MAVKMKGNDESFENVRDANEESTASDGVAGALDTVLARHTTRTFRAMLWLCCAFVPMRSAWVIFCPIFFAQAPPDGFYCSRVPLNASGLADAVNSNLTLAKNECPASGSGSGCEYVYFPGVEDTRFSIITDFELVCHRAVLSTIDKTAIYVAIIAGSALLTPLCDRIGRRRALLLTLWIQMVLSAVMTASTNVWMYIVAHVLLALWCGPAMSGTACFVAEWFPARERGAACNLLQVFWGFGLMTMCGASYLFPHSWRLTSAALTIPNLVTVFYYWTLPETPAYLWAKSDWEGLRRSLSRARFLGNWCRRPESGRDRQQQLEALLESELQKSTATTINRSNGDIHREVAEIKPKSSKKNAQSNSVLNPKKAALQIVKTPRLLSYYIVLTIVWLSLSVSYTLTTYSSANLSGDFYLNFISMAGLESSMIIVAVILTFVLPKGKLMPVACVLAGLCFLLAMVLQAVGILQAVTPLAIAARGIISGQYVLQILYTAEFNPTPVRGAGMGLFSIIENLAAAGAAVIADQQPPGFTGMNDAFWGASVSLLVVGALFTMMPETSNYPLPETYEDILRRPRRCACKTSNGDGSDLAMADVDAVVVSNGKTQPNGRRHDEEESF